jgi:ParB family chromosome partitioning protein
MSTRPNALGRGIGALLPSAPPAGVTPAAPAARQAPGELPIDRIDPNPEQPRRRFDADALAALSDSIRQHGVLQPVVVRRAGDRYQLLVGERRWRAARAAGLSAIPAVVADTPDRDRLEIALIENVQRRDLNPIELAHAFRTLLETGKTQDEIGRRVSLDRSTVANHVRLLELPRELQEDVEEQRLTAGHARALLQVGNPERRRHLRDKIVREQLSVRDAEALARPAGARARTPRTRPGTDPNLQRVIDALRQRLQTRVRVQGDGARGRIEIEYFGGEDLQRIAGILLGDA